MASEGPLTVPGTATPTRYAITPAWEPGRLGFLNTCQSVGFAQVDPIVAPGQPMSAHMHEFFGNPAITEHSTTAQIAATPRSSIQCHDKNDLAAYWSPAVYQDGVRIRARLFRAYYKGFNQTQEIQPMPVGLRMVAGNAHATSNQSAEIGWWEQTRSDSFTSIEDLANTRDSDTMIRVGSKQRISLRINYPSCWDGIHLDSPDHQSHVAYTVRGRCPATHPVPIPQLVTFTQYLTPGGEGLRLSSGPWYTFHQDFWNVWDEDQMSNLIERCIYTESNCRTGAGPQLQELGQTSTWIPLRS
jgi:hypothetical protein